MDIRERNAVVTEIYKTHGHYIEVCFRMFGISDYHDVADLKQDLFVKLLQMPEIRSEGIQGLLSTMARNLAQDHRRTKRNLVSLSEVEHMTASDVDVLKDIDIERCYDAARSYILRDEPVVTGSDLLYYMLMGFTWKQTADQFHVAEPTAKRWYASLCQWLRERFAGEKDEAVR